MKTVPADELSTELSESRRSLFKSCQEHFGVTPTQLQGSMHLDGVRIDRNQFGELPKKTASKAKYRPRCSLHSRQPKQIRVPSEHKSCTIGLTRGLTATEKP